MPAEALKAAWEVRAGVIPGEPIPELTRRFFYLSRELEEDRGHSDLAYHSIFSRRRAEALDYCLQLSVPHASNWAELTFLWY